MDNVGNGADRLPPYASRDEVSRRLQMIFPEGTPNRSYCTREIAASVVFTMLYIGAMDGSVVYLAPKHVYRMTVEQAALKDAASRNRYRANAVRPGFAPVGSRWYADNTREPIRDETLREGLMRVGAVTSRDDIPTTSSKPRYALRKEFATLFDPAIAGDDLRFAIEHFQTKSLSKGALARLEIVRHGAARGAAGHLVTFPNGETRQLAPGKSSTIAKAVIEVFATRFLRDPAVLSLSESGNKVVSRDESLSRKIGLKIEADRDLPDIILVELATSDPTLIFIEVVATDGPTTLRRREALLRRASAAGFSQDRVAFLTAYEDRDSAEFRRTFGSVAWGSSVWFVSEPDKLLVLAEQDSAVESFIRRLGPGT